MEAPVEWDSINSFNTKPYEAGGSVIMVISIFQMRSSGTKGFIILLMVTQLVSRRARV